jgi:NitT/TauT family transport system substrate-binding protein
MAAIIAASRRHFFAMAGAAAGMAGITRRALGAPRQIQILNDWLLGGANCGFVVAREKGFYRNVGLDVEVIPGKGSGSVAQQIGSKVAQVGFVDGYVMGHAVARGMPLKMVAGIFRRNPTAIITLTGSGIASPKQLAGKRIGISVGATQFQEWPAFVQGCGIDQSKVQIINVDPAASAAALITGKIDALAAFAQGMVPEIEIRGLKGTTIMWFADHGVTAVSNGIVVHQNLLNSDRNLVRNLVSASLLGFLYARFHPDEAVAIVRKYSPTADPQITRRELELSWNTWTTAQTLGRPLGWMSDNDWTSTISILKRYGGVTSPLSSATLFTNAFVPMDKALVPPKT